MIRSIQSTLFTDNLRQVWILKEIPKTATGKIQRRKVAETLLAKDTQAKL
jgi:acyl-coenzyme A synthetase/AMP-(fatty) acid ligase